MVERPRILIIDDDENIRESLAMLLEAKGYIVDTAKDGKEAVSKSNANFYNLALIDIRLPDMDGISLLTAMRETIPKMVKLIVTGYPSLENAVEAVNRGADGYILKPVDTNKLLSTIGEHLGKQRENKAYSEQKVKDYIETRAKEIDRR
jgi:DNA-binding NtrC family response regulator